MTTLSLSDIRAARDAIAGASVIKETPVDDSRAVSEATGGSVALKMEQLQRTGSFKPRGAYNKLRTVAEDPAIEQVVAASAGNHAQGVALGASAVGLDATVVMPETAPEAKKAATRGYGADVTLHGVDFDEAVEFALDLGEEDDAEFIHPFEDELVMAGQGTVGLEIYEARPSVDTVVVPIGGGGLIAGIGTALKALSDDVRVVGVQAEGAATAHRSLADGRIHEIDGVDTIADGIATRTLGSMAFEVLCECVDEVVVVSDREIASAVVLLLERSKTLVEGAGASPVAALLGDDLDVAGESVVAVLSGGNVDVSMLEEMFALVRDD